MVSSPQSCLVDFDKDYQSYLDSATSKVEVSDYTKQTMFVPCNADDLVSLSEACKEKTKDPCEVGFDTLVLDWYIRLLNPPEAYLRHLDYFRDHDKDGNFDDYLAGGYIRGFHFYEHKKKNENEEGTWSALPVVSCEPYNPCAKFKSIRSSASRTYSQLRRIKGCENIIFLDLTFPREISNLLLGSDQQYVVDKAQDCVARFFELLGSRLEAHINENKSSQNCQIIPSDATLGYQYNAHLWKTQEPINPHLHIHTDLLWAYYDGEELKPLKFHEKGKPLDADFVRSLWKQVVEEIFDYDYGDKDTDVYVKWAPLSWGTKILHRLKYRRRKPITDLGEYYLDHDFDPDSFDFGFNQYLLNYVNRSHTHGFWTFLVRLLKASSGSANTKRCPICGEKVVTDFVVPYEEAYFDRVVLQTRQGTFKSIKPPPEMEKNSGGDQYE